MLSAERASAVRAAVTDALEEIPDLVHLSDPDAVVEALKSAILDVVHATFKTFGQRHNDCVLAARVLPLELLCAIFDVLPISDCIIASHVCQTWRALLVYGCPSTWSALSGYSLPDGALTELLARSASADLKLKVKATTTNCKEVSRCLQAHLWRCTYLKLTIASGLSSDADAAATVTQALCRPAPRLRSFKVLDDGGALSASDAQAVTLLAHSAPDLRLLKFYGDMAVFGPGNVFESVTRLVYANPHNTTISDIQILTASFPRLQALSLDLDDWDEDAHDTPTDEVEPLALPRTLTDLLFIQTNKSDSDPVPLLSRLQHASVPRVQARYRYTPSAEQATRVLHEIAPAEPLPTLSFYPSGYEDSMNVIFSRKGYDFRLNEERVVTRIPRGVRPAGLDKITALSLGESAFDPEEAYPAMPALRYLTLLMLEPTEHARFAHESVFLLPRTADRVLVCSALRTLRIRAGALDEIRIAPEVVRELLQWHMSYEATRLEAIVLCGTELLQHVPDEVAALIALADNFHVVPAQPWESWGVEDVMNWH